MKNIYKIKLFLITLLVFSSCAINDDDPVTNVTKVTTAQLDKAGVVVTSGIAGETVNITLSSVLDSDTKIEYNLNGSDETIILPAGTSSYAFNFPTGTGIANAIKLTSAAGLYNNVILGDDTSVTFIGLPDPSPTSIELLAFNETGVDNFWFGLSEFDPSGNWVTDYDQNSAAGHPRPMSIPLNGNGLLGTIPNSASIAPNYLALNLFTQGTVPNPTGYTIYIVMPDGSYQVFEGSVPSTFFADNPIVGVNVVDDPANPGMKKYTFSAL
ncbi:hypothetical protein MC378_12365 [Polaribacter sp. MSW13]|uniref:DUF4397 domain-containing protein n=1 Tax=Polaribacter marinus TaxID=2916838 RepID=A0A9X2AKY4_9FLAO|nr:hypothetical protein [Polaribacter marinus]MCI2229963.1 hypothetical protein [Polaribacter marinus]